MGFIIRSVLTIVLAVPLFGISAGRALTNKETAVSPQAKVHEENIEEYIKLLRVDVRQQKAEIMGSLLLLSASDAAKFWPIYNQYDLELTKLNDEKAANIEEYANAYQQMTGERADELIRKAMTYQNQRSQLLDQTYERVKQAVGGATAARFVQIEHQLLSIIDLQIASSLPVIGQAS